jgi:hypothetical protein
MLCSMVSAVADEASSPKHGRLHSVACWFMLAFGTSLHHHQRKLLLLQTHIKLCPYQWLFTGQESGLTAAVVCCALCLQVGVTGQPNLFWQPTFVFPGQLGPNYPKVRLCARKGSNMAQIMSGKALTMPNNNKLNYIIHFKL